MADLPATTRPDIRAARKRRVAGWVLLVLGVLITGVWGASGWWQFGCTRFGWSVIFSNGACMLLNAGGQAIAKNRDFVRAHRLYAENRGWSWAVGQATVNGRADDRQISILGIASTVDWGSARLYNLMLWPFALASLLGGGFLLWSGRRARRRAMTGVCLKCGYDLAGLAANAPCPECGHVSP